jgi:hypothetical protein
MDMNSLAPSTWIRWRIDGANHFAPPSIGALVKNDGAKGCAISFFPMARRWRSGALLEGLHMSITTGRPLTWEEWVQATEQLEAKAKLAEQRGLPKTAQSWRAMIDNLPVHDRGNLVPEDLKDLKDLKIHPEIFPLTCAPRRRRYAIGACLRL